MNYKTYTFSGKLIDMEYVTDTSRMTRLGLLNDASIAKPICNEIYRQYIPNKRNVSMRYYISEKSMLHTELVSLQMKKLYGNLSVEDEYEVEEFRYSEWTADTMVTDEESVVIGGHDLLKEFKSHIGKYLYLEIQAKV